MVLLGLMLLPALILVGVLVQARKVLGLDDQIVAYASYPVTTPLLISVFVAAQATALVSRDLRFGTITLYLARPIRRVTYVLDRLASLTAATFAVNDVSMTIGPGVTALLGPNGAGKATLIARMSGFLAPATGTVTLDGDPPWRNEEVHRRIGLVPEREALFDYLTVLFSSHILEEVEQVARQSEVWVAGRHAASGDFGAIRRLMTDRPSRFVLRTGDDRRLAAVLLADPSVRGVRLRAEGGLELEASDFGRFSEGLPRLAREHAVRLLEMSPTDGTRRGTRRARHTAAARLGPCARSSRAASSSTSATT